MYNSEMIDLFVNNFVVKERRERSAFELRQEKKRNHFVDKLNHAWSEVLDMRYITKIVNVGSEYDYAIDQLSIRTKDKCYVISNYDDLDDQTMSFENAFEKCYGRGFATAIMLTTGNKLYLETEIELSGKQNRFIGTHTIVQNK